MTTRYLGILTAFSIATGLALASASPPETKVEPVVETIHGVEITDPYRWLENQESPETRHWIERQNAYTDSVLKNLAGRDQIRSLAQNVVSRHTVGIPIERGGRYFFSKQQADKNLSVIYVREGVHGADRILIDPHLLAADHSLSVSIQSVSSDGKWVAYAIRQGGMDEVSVRIRNVDTGEDLPDTLPAARYGAITLDPHGGGIYYDRYGDIAPRVMYHRFGTPIARDTMVFKIGDHLTN